MELLVRNKKHIHHIPFYITDIIEYRKFIKHHYNEEKHPTIRKISDINIFVEEYDHKILSFTEQVFKIFKQDNIEHFIKILPKTDIQEIHLLNLEMTLTQFINLSDSLLSCDTTNINSIELKCVRIIDNMNNDIIVSKYSNLISQLSIDTLHISWINIGSLGDINLISQAIKY